MTEPGPRKCVTPGCNVMVPVDHDPEGIELSTGKVPAWVWACPGCGRKRLEPVPRVRPALIDASKDTVVVGVEGEF